MREVFFEPKKGVLLGFAVLKLVKSVLPIQRCTSKKRDTLYITKLFWFLPGPALDRPVGIVEFKLVLLVEIQRSKYSQKIRKRFSTGIGLPPLLSALPWNSHLRPLGLALIHFRLRIGRRLSWSECKIWNICTAAGAAGGNEAELCTRGVGYNLLPPGPGRGLGV